MRQQDVKAAIETVMPRILEFGTQEPYNSEAPANYHETSTRYTIIDPILRSLGWDLSDPNQCAVEFPVPAGVGIERPDYILFDRRGAPAVVIEACRIDVFTDHYDKRKQLRRYLCHLEPRAGVITDGVY